MTEVAPPRIGVNVFSCKGCGGPMHYDPETKGLRCVQCGSTEALPDTLLESPEYCYDPQKDAYQAPDWDTTGSRTMYCPGCGAQTVVSAAVMTMDCPYCGSTYVVQEDTVTVGILPETMMPFQVSRHNAVGRLLEWLKKRFWAPREFKKKVLQEEQLKGLYVPFWTYDAHVETSYTGQGGRDRTVTRTREVNGKTETYTETVTDWFPISGADALDFDDIPVCADKHMDVSLLRKLGAFSMKQLFRYQPAYLAGFLAERYDVGIGEGWNTASGQMQEDMQSYIEASLGYDHYANMCYTHQFFNARFKHILLPVWMSSLTYKNKTYPVMVNGETGKVAGRTPVSPWKVLAAVGIALAVAAIIAVLVLCFSDAAA